MALGPLPLELVTAAKALAHWIACGLPLIVATPLLGLLLNLPAEAFWILVVTMLTGSPAISFIGSIGAALTLGLKRGGPLLPLLILPLYVPVLIFGVAAIDAVVTGPGSWTQPLLVLCALALASVALAPIAAAAALRLNLQ
jgi:heme exporter protein B